MNCIMQNRWELRKKLVAKNAGHTEAKYSLGEEYWNEVFKFIDENK